MPFSLNHRLFFILLAGLTLLAGGTRLAAQVTSAFSAGGLTSVKYQGAEFVADGTVYSIVILQNSAGTRYENGPLTNTFDLAQKRRTITYPWGSVTVTYVTAGSRVTFQVAVTNNSNDPVVECSLGLFTAQFPSQPAGSGWANGFEMADLNIDDITAVPADYGTGLLVLCNDQPGPPLKFGFSSPDGAQHRLVRMTTVVTNCPDDPRIAPHSAAQYAFSMRFAPGGTDPETLIGDLHAALAAQIPHVLSWPDRRAIGTLFLASGYHASATNPRGWLNEPTLNTVTPAGLANFRTQMLAKADDTIARLQQMNAQGMIFWNVEGEQYPYITYAGDPRVVGSLAPEMDGIANEFFAKFTAAGLRTGVCLRPSRIVPGFPGNGHVWDHDNYGFDVLTNLSDKINYAKNRWGCTLFYVDSNVEWVFDNAGNFVPRLIRASLFASLQALHPEVLVIPEIPRTAYWAATAPYREVASGGFYETAARSRAAYPQALTVIEPKDCDWVANHTALVNAVRGGDILLFRSWYPDSGNPQVQAIYAEAHPAPIITSAGRVSVDAGAAFSYTITATNAPVSFGANGRPVSLQLNSASGVISGTAPLFADDFTIVLSASSLWGTGQKTLALHVRGPLELWRTLHFSGMENTAAAADDADPDGDGFTNYFEFALGLNPTARDARAVAPHVGKITAVGSDWLAITFRRRKAVPPGVDYIVEESTGLATWSVVDSTANQIGTPIDQLDGTELVTIRGTHALGSTPPAFLRLRISAP